MSKIVSTSHWRGEKKCDTGLFRQRMQDRKLDRKEAQGSVLWEETQRKKVIEKYPQKKRRRSEEKKQAVLLNQNPLAKIGTRPARECARRKQAAAAAAARKSRNALSDH